MKVSVITSVYNMERYLDRCIASVLSQSFKDFELILLNDGSTDKTGLICEKWADKDERIEYISKDNEGLGASRNLGIQLAKGEYIAFLDADDWIENNFLELMIKTAIRDEADVVISDMCFVNVYDDGINKTISKIRFKEGLIYPENELNYFGKCRTFLCGKLFKKKMFEDNNILLPKHAYEDVSVVPYLMYRSKRTSYVEGALYNYFRNRNGSIINDFKQLNYLTVSLTELFDKFHDEKEVMSNNYSIDCNYSESGIRCALMNLFWGQVCNIWRLTESRFSEENNDDIQNVRNNSIKTFCEYFPEGKGMDEIRYFVDGNQIIRNALMKLLLNSNQITDNIDDARVVICDKKKSYELHNKTVIILNDTKVSGDVDTDEWNITDMLFDRIYNELLCSDKAIKPL